MNDETYDEYSSLLDGELDDAQEQHALQQLANDKDGRDRVARYGLISEALRGESVNPDAVSIADRVRESLANEPVVLAPRPTQPPKQRHWWQPAAGLAIAASVALVAVGLLPRMLSDVPEMGANPVQVVGNPTIAPTLVSAPRTQWAGSRPEQQERLNRYLAEHNEFAPQGSAPGITPYATFVSYDDEE